MAHFPIDWFWLLIFPTNLVRGFSNKEIKFQNNRAILVQIVLLLISQPRNQSQSITSISTGNLKCWKMSWSTLSNKQMFIHLEKFLNKSLGFENTRNMAISRILAPNFKKKKLLVLWLEKCRWRMGLWPLHRYGIRTEILSKMKLFRPRPATPSQCRAFWKTSSGIVHITCPCKFSSFLDVRNTSNRFQLFSRDFRRFRFFYPWSACFSNLPPPQNLPSWVK